MSVPGGRADFNFGRLDFPVLANNGHSRLWAEKRLVRVPVVLRFFTLEKNARHIRLLEAVRDREGNPAIMNGHVKFSQREA